MAEWLGARRAPDLFPALDLMRTVAALERGADRGRVAFPPLGASGRQQIVYHGLLPVLQPWAGLLGLCSEDDGWLTRTRAETTARALRAASSVVFAHRVLGAAGVDALALKGATQSVRTTGRVDGRVYSDVDVLVAPGSLDPADAALRDAGYLPFGPTSSASAGPYRRWALVVGYHVAYRHPSKLHLELHWRAGHPGLLDTGFAALWPRRRAVPVGGIDVAALGDVDEVLFSAVHGACHRFCRLAWLVDFARLARRAPWEEVLAAASDAGVLRPVAMAASMAAEVDPELPAVPTTGRESRLVAVVSRSAWRAIGRSEHTRRSVLGACVSEMALRRSAAFKAATVATTLLPLNQLEAARRPGFAAFASVAVQKFLPRRLRSSRPRPPLRLEETLASRLPASANLPGDSSQREVAGL